MRKPIVAAVYLLSLALLVSLGVWQIQRAQVKQLIEQRSEGNHSSPKLITVLSDAHENLQYKDVRLQGKWLDAQSFLLLNRIYHRQVGVEVLTPFELTSGDTIIVNRGWTDKQQMPNIEIVTNSSPVEITGTMYIPAKGVRIGESITPSDSWPKESLYLDTQAFSQTLGRSVSSMVLVLESQQAASFKRIWKAVSMSSKKHFGYAVQWFGLAFTLLIFGFIWFIKKV